MGELVVGKPTFQLISTTSIPLDYSSVLALLYRAVPGSGLHPDLIEQRRSLPPEVMRDLDLLHGFSGRLLYYMEEPAIAFYQSGAKQPISFDEYLEYLEESSPERFREWAIRALERVHQDLGTGQVPPIGTDASEWRNFVLPALTTASPDESLELLANPEELKRRTIDLMRYIWDSWYDLERRQQLATMEQAAHLGLPKFNQGFGMAFTDLTGNRLPATLVSRLNEVERVLFVPSAFLGNFVSFIVHPPKLIVYYGAPEFLSRENVRPATTSGNGIHLPVRTDATILADGENLEGFRALSDLNRLRILDLLLEGEMYAQEIVGRLGIAQSAVSRHLSLLERSGLIRVRPLGGAKYYAIDEARMDELASALCSHCKQS